MKKKFAPFKSIFFIVAIFVLLLNDFYLKPTFHNTITGKLSDFAGLFVFAIFWSVFFPKFRKAVFILTGFLFVLWKSSLSQPFIDSWNETMFFAIDRVVDSTDLLALLILPLAYSIEKFKWANFKLSIHPALPILVSAFAFMATSQRQYSDVHKNYLLEMSKDTLAARLKRIDGINNNEPIIFTCKNPDTVYLKLPYPHCDELEVKIAISDININKIEVQLIRATRLCDELRKNEEKIEEIVIAEFEKRIIEKVK